MEKKWIISRKCDVQSASEEFKERTPPYLAKEEIVGKT
jgi:hypothetical protein